MSTAAGASGSAVTSMAATLYGPSDARAWALTGASWSSWMLSLIDRIDASRSPTGVRDSASELTRPATVSPSVVSGPPSANTASSITPPTVLISVSSTGAISAEIRPTTTPVLLLTNAASPVSTSPRVPVSCRSSVPGSSPPTSA